MHKDFLHTLSCSSWPVQLLYCASVFLQPAPSHPHGSYTLPGSDLQSPDVDRGHGGWALSISTAHGMLSQQHSAVWNHNQFMLLFKHMPCDEVHKAAIKNIAYTVVWQAARPVQATTASQTVNHQVIPKVISPLKISAIKLRLLPWATIISYQAIRASLCYSEWDVLGSYHKEKCLVWEPRSTHRKDRKPRKEEQFLGEQQLCRLYSRLCFIGFCFTFVLNSWSKELQSTNYW